MASKDQAIGAVLLIVCLLVAIGYIIVVAWPDAVLRVFNPLGMRREELQFGAVASVVLIAFLAIMFIGAWIGWTMATTPPPKPIEELETEMEEEKAKTEEKTVEEAETIKQETVAKAESEVGAAKRKKKE